MLPKVNDIRYLNGQPEFRKLISTRKGLSIIRLVRHRSEKVDRESVLNAHSRDQDSVILGHIHTQFE